MSLLNWFSRTKSKSDLRASSSGSPTTPRGSSPRRDETPTPASVVNEASSPSTPSAPSAPSTPSSPSLQSVPSPSLSSGPLSARGRAASVATYKIAPDDDTDAPKAPPSHLKPKLLPRQSTNSLPSPKSSTQNGEPSSIPPRKKEGLTRANRSKTINLTFHKTRDTYSEKEKKQLPSLRELLDRFGTDAGNLNAVMEAEKNAKMQSFEGPKHSNSSVPHYATISRKRGKAMPKLDMDQKSEEKIELSQSTAEATSPSDDKEKPQLARSHSEPDLLSPRAQNSETPTPTASPSMTKMKKEKQSSSKKSLEISAPMNIQHKLHVSSDFVWSGEDPELTFEVLDRLGGGAFGSVHKAIHRATGFPIAIKKVKIQSEEQRKSVETEIAILRACRNEHVVNYYGCIVKDAFLWILMDFCSVGSVEDLIKKSPNNSLEEDRIAEILCATIKGLAYLHKINVIHCDLKSGNILLDDNQKVKLTDFGVSAKGQYSTSTKEGQGTPLFMAPELFGDLTPSSKADIWSIGITAIEMAEGKPPHFGLNPMRIIYIIPNSDPPKLSHPEKFSPEFVDFITSCLKKEPSDRPTADVLLSHPFLTRGEDLILARHALLSPSPKIKDRQSYSKSSSSFRIRSGTLDKSSRSSFRGRKSVKDLFSQSSDDEASQNGISEGGSSIKSDKLSVKLFETQIKILEKDLETEKDKANEMKLILEEMKELTNKLQRELRLEKAKNSLLSTELQSKTKEITKKDKVISDLREAAKAAELRQKRESIDLRGKTAR